jgi:hypothetical protein
VDAAGAATAMALMTRPIPGMQYTVRGIPPTLDAASRERARKRRDLGDIAGTWKANKAAEAALAEQDQVDESLWRSLTFHLRTQSRTMFPV